MDVSSTFTLMQILDLGLPYRSLIAYLGYKYLICLAC